MSTHSARLAELGIELPAVAAPLAAYQPAVRSGNHVYTSGQLPMVDGNLATAGKVGAEVSPEDAKALARICALNAVAAVDALVGINNVVKVVKVVGFVASAPGFTGQPGVVNGASELLGRYSGKRACMRARLLVLPSCRSTPPWRSRSWWRSERKCPHSAPRLRATAAGHRDRLGAAGQ